MRAQAEERPRLSDVQGGVLLGICQLSVLRGRIGRTIVLWQELKSAK